LRKIKQFFMESSKYGYERINRPTNEKFESICNKYGFHLTQKEVQEFQLLMDQQLTVFDELYQMPDNLPLVKYPRTPGYYPSPEENKLNAWYYKCEVKGASTGKLAGRKIALKDNICLAGVPMMNSYYHFEGFTPELDATVVTRILDAGGTIIGKTHCDCLAAGGFVNSKVAVENPHKPGHASGGSSSGDGALLGAGEIDLAVGGDQAGSIRIPASWSGCYGMKPTFGLVPYSGAIGMEPSLDHLGPMTNNVYDNALLLEVMAGPDGMDPRQYIPLTVSFDYTSKIKEGVKGMKIGVLKEAFEFPKNEVTVNRRVKKAAEGFKELGAIVEEVSIPEHKTGFHVFLGVWTEGIWRTFMDGNAYGTGYKGLYHPSAMKQQARWKAHPDQISRISKFFTIMGDFLWNEFDGTFYAKAQNLGRKYKEYYDEMLNKYDILIMPTVPIRAPKQVSDPTMFISYAEKAVGNFANTAIFNVTGHPAFSIPVAMVNDLPIGMTIISKHFHEATIYQAAYAWEQAYDWKKNEHSLE